MARTLIEDYGRPLDLEQATQAECAFRLWRFQVKWTPVHRPQTPKPPFKYESEDVSFKNDKQGHELAGTLTLPSQGGPFPCVVLVSGSGPQDRDETLLGHKPFAVIADHLANHGIATLRYDDRGTGKSKGDFMAATTADTRSESVEATTRAAKVEAHMPCSATVAR